MKALDDFVLSHTRVRKLLSLFVAIIDEQKWALHYINAGHVPPVIVRWAGEIIKLDEGGLLLGVIPDATYRRGTA